MFPRGLEGELTPARTWFALALTLPFPAVGVGLCGAPSPQKLHGVACDQATRRTIPYANVMVLGTRIGTMADGCGMFTLEPPPGRQCLILVMAPGYEKRSLPWPATRDEPAPFVIVRLKPSSHQDGVAH
jgi:hypothetical protein